MAYLRLLLLPFSGFYGLVIWIRNRCYDWGWLKSTSFDHPIIVVGNLAIGGTGKSPMTEYLIRLLSDRYKIATLSRGYGRKTRGFLEVDITDTASRCGDEPLQFKHKFPYITVAVSENRVNGVRRLLQQGCEVVVLDDAYQHRALRPGLTILLFDYRAMAQPKWLLPAGNYRDSFRERRRADLIMVTKTPNEVSARAKERIRSKLETARHIPVLFSGISYGKLTRLQAGGVADVAEFSPDVSVLLVTGIANPEPLYHHLKAQVRELVPIRFPDHHRYTVADMQQIISRFDDISHPSKLIVTTEKDAQRLREPSLLPLLEDLPIYLVPITIRFEDNDEDTIQHMVLNYCRGALK